MPLSYDLKTRFVSISLLIGVESPLCFVWNEMDNSGFGLELPSLFKFKLDLFTFLHVGSEFPVCVKFKLDLLRPST